MDLNSRVNHMDEELKLLKNEIKQVLLEVQEHVLNVQNPFSTASAFGQRAAAPAPSEQQFPQYTPGGGGGAPTVIVDTSTTGAGGSHEATPASAARPVDDRVSPPQPPKPEPDEKPLVQEDDFIPATPSLDDDSDDSEEFYTPPRHAEERREKKEPAPRPRKGPERPKAAQRWERVDPRFDDLDDYEDEDEITGARGQRPGIGETPVPDPRPQTPDPQRRQRVMDLITLAGLAQWTQSVLRKVGRQHLESLLEVSERTGRIPKETREILTALIPLFEANTSEGGVSAKEIIGLMAQLDGFLGTASATDTKLLPFLLQDELEVFPLIRP